MHCKGFEVSDLPDNNCLARICVEASWTVKRHTFHYESRPCLIFCSPHSWKHGSPLTIFSVLNLRLYQLQVAFQIVLQVDQLMGMPRAVCRIARLATRKKSKLHPINGSFVHNISNPGCHFLYIVGIPHGYRMPLSPHGRNLYDL